MRKFILFPALLLTLMASAAVFADSWAVPSEKIVCSANNKYCLKITPKKLPGQIEEGSTLKDEENYCKGTFFARGGKRKTDARWSIRLANEIAPVSALITDDGNYLVTFDNWASMGYGDNAVVIYDANNGSVIKKFALTDFLTESDYTKLSRSVSSIWWAGGKHKIEDEKLVLNVAGPGNDGHSENGERFFIDIDLATGAMLSEKKDHYPAQVIEVLN